MWDILNSIPVVGQVKGVVHLLTGDVQAGERAMRAATRSTAVFGAGAVGMLAGPVGAAGLGIYVGTFWDCIESAATGESTGIVAGLENIVETASKGEVPVAGILQTGLTVTGDLLGGLGGGSLAVSASKVAGQSAANAIGKSAGKSAGETIIKSVGGKAGETFSKTVIGEAVAKNVTKSVIVSHALAKDTENKLRRNQKNKRTQQYQTPKNSITSTTCGSTTGGTATGGSSNGNDQQPPNQNPRKSSAPKQRSNPELDALLNIFGVASLGEIFIRGQPIFQNLREDQLRQLRNIIRIILMDENGESTRVDMLRRIIETIVNIFNTFDLEEITYVNFISLIEFILHYLSERKARANDLSDSTASYNQRCNVVVEIVATEFTRHDYTIVNVFNEIRREMELHTLHINFRNLFSAVYHYFKHRIVGRYELSVRQYYNLVNRNYRIIGYLPEFRNLLQNGGGINFSRYYAYYGKMLRIGIKKQGDNVNLATCFFIDEDIEEGEYEDGDIFINNRKIEPDEYEEESEDSD